MAYLFTGRIELNVILYSFPVASKTENVTQEANLIIMYNVGQFSPMSSILT